MDEEVDYVSYVEESIQGLRDIPANEYSDDAELVINTVIEDLNEVLDWLKGDV